ncbi:MAG TPA: energy transducer TonB [bacterium]|nr:energy transducer TonB [bacterium]
MKNDKVLIYALIISVIVHSALILFLLNYANKKTKKTHEYTKPILVEPYQFIKNLKKFRIKKPKSASIKSHYARKNTRLNAPPSSGKLPAREKRHTPYTPPAPFYEKYAQNHKENGTVVQSRRIISNAHIISRSKAVRPERSRRLSSLLPAEKRFFNLKTKNVKSAGIRNPSRGIKSATVNLNTTTIKYASYLLHVKNKIENVWEYPRKARMEGISGTLVIKFSINKNGSIYNVRILRSSRKKMLDKAAVRAIREAARYNPFPHYWKINRLNIIGTFIYELSNFYVY